MASVTISADDTTFTDWLQVGPGRDFMVVCHSDSSFSGTVTCQMKQLHEDTSAARDVETYTTNTIPPKVGKVPTREWMVRIGCKDGEFTSGSMIAEVTT